MTCGTVALADEVVECRGFSWALRHGRWWRWRRVTAVLRGSIRANLTDAKRTTSCTIVSTSASSARCWPLQ